MPKIRYASYDDYVSKDPKFFVRVLKDELHKAQSKIHFADGTTYHVTKSGARYWELPGLAWKRESSYGVHFYCRDYHKPIKNEDEFKAAITEVTANRKIIDAEKADVYPVMITIGSDKWVDPDIGDWFEGQECPDNKGVDRDIFIHQVNIKSHIDESITMDVWFKSGYMIDKMIKFNNDSKNDPSLKMNQYPYVCTQKVVDSVVDAITIDAKKCGLADSRFGNKVTALMAKLGGHFSYNINPYSTLYGDKAGYWCE